jgi:hypothetical protein
MFLQAIAVGSMSAGASGLAKPECAVHCVRPSLAVSKHLRSMASAITFWREAPHQFRTRGSGKRTIQRAPELDSTSNVPFS